jgi:hypothetical protein
MTIEDYFRFRAKDRGHGDRVMLAAEALILLVVADPRFVAAYNAWRRMSGLDEKIHRWAIAATPQAKKQRQDDFMAAWGPAVTLTARVLPEFVATELQLPYPWLSVALSSAFVMRVADDVGVPLTTHLPFAGLVGPKAGRKAIKKQDSIRRNVEWFYRLHVQSPPDKQADLEKEYRAAVRRNTDAHGNVAKGVKEAKQLLDAFAYRYESGGDGPSTKKTLPLTKET